MYALPQFFKKENNQSMYFTVLVEYRRKCRLPSLLMSLHSRV